MNSTAEEDLSRVTVISPTRRIDLALPGSVTLGELLPTIVRFAGFEASNTSDAVHGWVLQRFGEDPLDPNQLVNTLAIRDGETLHLRQRDNTMPDAAFDDVVDAVSSTASQRPSWAQKHSQRMAIAALCAMIVGLPAVFMLAPLLSFGGHGGPAPMGPVFRAVWASLTLLVALACVITSVALSRAVGEYRVASAFAWCAAALALMGGYGVMPDGTPTSVRFLIAAAAVLVVTAASALSARVQVGGLFTAAAASTLILGATIAMALWPGHTVKVAAIAITILLAVTPVLPTVSYRAARIALPNLPATTEAMLADETPVQSDIVSRALIADRLLASLLTACNISITLLAIPLVRRGGLWCLLLTGATALALLLRARAFVGLSQRLSLLIGGLTLALITAFAVLPRIDNPLVLALLMVATLVAEIVLAYYASALYRKVLAPTWGRFGDISEWLAVMTIVPALIGVLGLYARARGMFS